MVMMSIRKILSVTSVALCVCFFLFSFSSAQSLSKFSIEKQWVKIWINKEDGTIDILYNLTLVCNFDRISWITIGQPNEHFSVTSCEDLQNHTLGYSEIRDSWTGVNLTLHEPIYGGESVTVILRTRVDRMIWEDKMNPGNVGLVFIPCWWNVIVEDLRVALVLPENVKQIEIRCQPNYTNCEPDSQYPSRLQVYWNQTNLPPNQQFQIGVSFPQEYVDWWYSENPWDWVGGVLASLVLPIVALSIIGVAAVIVFKNLKRFPYSSPSFAMEALGVRKGLTAVEAATLLDVEPRRILTCLLYTSDAADE